MTEYLKNKIFDEIKVGDTAKLNHVLRKKDIELFAILSGDVNPAHLDVEFARNDPFHRLIAHGMWGGALISTVLGTLLPGPGTIYLGQTLHFRRPVAIGDMVTASVTVIKKYLRKPVVVLQCTLSNQRGKKVITGIAKVLAPTKKVKRKPIRLPKIKYVNS